MIERAIENWLTNTNERNYQVAFCQVLMLKGHRVIYNSSHQQMEQGKDIITIGPDGDYYAYQLKTGDINLVEWRKIREEVMELVELPIVHPSVDKTKGHKSFLVTNGDVTDSVRIQIDQRNEDNLRQKRNYSYLDIINRQSLLKDFNEAQGRFVPKELEDIQSLLKLFLADGTDLLDKEQLFNFLNITIFEDIPRQKSDAKNAISSSVIITAFLLHPYQLKENHFAIFEAWTCLAGCIVRYAHKASLEKAGWVESFKLVMSEMERNLLLLKQETLKRKNLLEGDGLGDGGLMYRARVTIVLGTLSALEIHLQKIKDKYIKDDRIMKLIKENEKFLWFWGESAFPYFFSITKYLELNDEEQEAQSLLDNIFLTIINSNSPYNEEGLASPYYSIHDILEVLYKFNVRKIDFKNFAGNSYTLETMLLMLARRNRREILEQNWRKLSHIHINEFKFDNIEDTFCWYAEEGENSADFPTQTQSWTELVSKANDISEVPELLLKNADLLRFFILVCPHRINKQIIGILDQGR